MASNALVFQGRRVGGYFLVGIVCQKQIREITAVFSATHMCGGRDFAHCRYKWTLCAPYWLYCLVSSETVNCAVNTQPCGAGNKINEDQFGWFHGFLWICSVNISDWVIWAIFEIHIELVQWIPLIAWRNTIFLIAIERKWHHCLVFYFGKSLPLFSFLLLFSLFLIFLPILY